MRIIIGYDIISHHYQARIEIGKDTYNFTKGDACIPYQGIQMQGKEVDDFLKWINRISNDHLTDELTTDN